MVDVYLMFGPQGSGKSTQGLQLAEKFNLPYFDAGKALRELASSATEAGNRVEQNMQKGELVPNSVIKSLFYSFMKEQDCTRGMVADGFPRNEVQIELLDELARAHNWQIVGIFIDIDDATAKKRLAKRTVVIDGVEQTREDDQPEIVAKRLETFRRETLPVVNWLKENWRLLTIDGAPSADEVTKTVFLAIKP